MTLPDALTYSFVAFVLGACFMALIAHIAGPRRIIVQSPPAKPSQPRRSDGRFEKKPDPLIQAGWTPKGLVEK